MSDLEDRVAAIIGAGSGIGAAAILLASQGVSEMPDARRLNHLAGSKKAVLF